MNDDRFDREIRRFLDWDASHIPGAPSRDDMVERLASLATLEGVQQRPFRMTPALRVVLALGLLAALIAGGVAAGAWWIQRNPIVVGPPPAMPTGLVPAGRYSILESKFTAARYTVTVPEGWTLDDEGFISKGDPGASNGVSLTTWIVSHVYADACQWTGTLREAGSRDLLVAGLATQAGHRTTGPSEVTLGGYPATRLELSVPASFDVTSCEFDTIRLWPDIGGDETGGQRIAAGQIVTVYAIEQSGNPTVPMQSGNPTVLMTIRRDSSPADDVAALQAILDSIQFER